MKTEIGHYEVNGQIFTSKLAAILEAQRLNTDLKWVYFDDVFNNVDWKNEPLPSLDLLYAERAKQIREAYDYVVVFVSGGADSNNVIRTFINNNIHVDEVIGMAPISGLEKWDWNKTDKSPLNTISEIKFAQFPIMDEVSTRSPNTKVTLLDFFKDIIEVKPDEWLYENSVEYISPVTTPHGRLDSLTHLTNLAEGGKRIALVWGIDKPMILLNRQGDIFTALADVGTTSRVQPPFKKDYPNVDRVFFYWTHEMPEVMVKQAHVVAREMFKPHNKHILNAAIDVSLRASEPETTLSQDEILAKTIPYLKGNYKLPDTVKNYSRSIFQREIVPLIYPTTFTKDLFQCEKFDTKQSFFVEHQSWFWLLHKDALRLDMIASDFASFYKTLESRFLNKSRTGFNPIVRLYRIGNKADFV